MEMSGTNRDLENPKPPIRYELIDKDGRVHGSGSKGDLIDLAHALWPGQPQESGDGLDPTSWDIQIAGAK